MTKKRPGDHTYDATHPQEQMQQASADIWDAHNQSRLVRLADLFEVDPASLPLEDLRTLHSFARQVIGPQLSKTSLDPVTLSKLIASVERQARDAAQLKDRLSGGPVSEVVQAEVADLSDFLNDALVQLRRQASRLQ